MSHRRLGIGLVASGLLLGAGGFLLAPSSADNSPSAAEDPPAATTPRVDCKKAVIDSDAPVATYVTPPPADYPLQKHPGSDIQMTTALTTSDSIIAYVKVANIPTTSVDTAPEAGNGMAAHQTGIEYRIDFAFGETKKFYVYKRHIADPYKSVPVIGGTFADQNLLITVKDFVIDPASDWVTVTLIRSEIQKWLGESYELIDGEAEVKHTATAAQMIATRPVVTDTTEQSKVVFGDDYCFGPPPAMIVDLEGHTGVQFGDTAKLSVAILDDDEGPLEGKEVVFKAGGKEVKDTSDADGIVEVNFPADIPAKDYPLEITYAGDAEVGKGKMNAILKVKTEAAAFRPPAVSGRKVTVTLVDDDKPAAKPIAGQSVDILVNGKKLKSATTNSAGQVAHIGAAGQTIQFKFAGATGKYTGATSQAKKV